MVIGCCVLLIHRKGNQTLLYRRAGVQYIQWYES